MAPEHRGVEAGISMEGDRTRAGVYFGIASGRLKRPALVWLVFRTFVAAGLESVRARRDGFDNPVFLFRFAIGIPAPDLIALFPRRPSSSPGRRRRRAWRRHVRFSWLRSPWFKELIG